MLSLPSRERGLKFLFSKILIIFLTVAPFAGAWIEIALKELKNLVNTVAPFAGAWIEIDDVAEGITQSVRRSLRGSVD